MFTRPENRIRIHTTTTGLGLVIVPRHTLLGVELTDGKPSAVKYPDYRYYAKSDYRTFTTLKGINKVEYDWIKPDLVLYELADGSLLQANRELFDGSEMDTHNATSDDQPCFTHDVSKLELVEMPEVKEVPTFDL